MDHRDRDFRGPSATMAPAAVAAPATAARNPSPEKHDVRDNHNTNKHSYSSSSNNNNNNGSSNISSGKREKGLAWWKLARPERSGRRRPSLADISSSGSTNSSSRTILNSIGTGTSSSTANSTVRKIYSQPRELLQSAPPPSSAERLLFYDDDNLTTVSTSTSSCGRAGGGAGGEPGGRFTSGGQPKKHHHQRNLWTRGSGEGTEAPSPEEDDDGSNNNIADLHHPSFSCSAATVDADATAFPRVLIPKYNNGSGGRTEPVRLRRQPFLLSDLTNCAPRGKATRAEAAAATAATAGAACCRIPDPASSTAPITATAAAATAAAAAAVPVAAAADADATASPSPGTPVEGVSSDDSWPGTSGRRGPRPDENLSGGEGGGRDQPCRREAKKHRTPSKPPRTQDRLEHSASSSSPLAAAVEWAVRSSPSAAASVSNAGPAAAAAAAAAAAVAAAPGAAAAAAPAVAAVEVIVVTESALTAKVNGSGGGGGGRDGVEGVIAGSTAAALDPDLAEMICDEREEEAEDEEQEEEEEEEKGRGGERIHLREEHEGGEGMDDDTAVGMAREPSVVYDILAVDRGCGYCDTSVVPFHVDDGGEVPGEKMRALTAGQGQFLARRGFAAGLVAHFLEETNCEFRVLQGGASCGMNAQQLEEAAVRLEEAFVPAVKRLRGRSSMEVVLDSLFEGEDDAGQFVVRFEVTVTRCHPEDLDASPASALRDCAQAIREAVREEGVEEHSTHEVVFVGRPMWELVSPVLDLSLKDEDNSNASSG